MRIVAEAEIWHKKECKVYVYKGLCGLSLLVLNVQQKGSVKLSILYSIDVAMSLYIVITVYMLLLLSISVVLIVLIL